MCSSLPSTSFVITYSWKIRQGIKFCCLAVGVETAKLKSANIISYATGNDIMHAVFLALSSIPLVAAHVASLALARCQFYFL